MFTVQTFTTRLDANHPHGGIGYEVIESTNRVAAAPHARDNGIWELASHFAQLQLDLSTDDALEVTYDGWERMRPNGGADEIVRGGEVRDPVPEGFVDRIFEGARA
jgi:hypothetical protein